MAKNRRAVWAHDAVDLDGEEHMRVIVWRQHADTRECDGTDAYLGIGWLIVEFREGHGMTIIRVGMVVLLVARSSTSTFTT